MAERLSIIIEVDSRAGETAVARMNRAISTMGGALSRIATAGGRQIDRLAASFARSAQAAQGMSFAAAGLGLGLSGGLIAGVKSALMLSSSLETAKIAYEVMLGSAEKAGAFIRDLYRFAMETPFTFTGLIEQGKLLKAYGFEIGQIIPILTAAGNAAAALGQDKLPNITRALGQIQAKGRVQTQELLQLQEAGVNATKALADAAGKSTGEMLKAVEQGIVPAQEAIKAIVDSMNRDFPNLMKRQMVTLTGVFSNFQDQVEMMMATIGDALSPAVIRLVKSLQPMVAQVGDLARLFKDLPPPIRDTAIAIGGLTIAFVALATTLPILFGAGGFVLRGVGIMLSFASTAGTVATAVRMGLTGALIGSEAVLLKVAAATGVVVAAIVLLKDALDFRRAVTEAKALGDVFGSLRDVVNELSFNPLPEFFRLLAGPMSVIRDLAWDIAVGLKAAVAEGARLARGPLGAAAAAIDRANQLAEWATGTSSGAIEAGARRNLEAVQAANLARARAEADKATTAGQTASLRAAMEAAAARTKAIADAKAAAKAALAEARTAERRAAAELQSAVIGEVDGMGRLIVRYVELRDEIGKTAKSRADLAMAFQIRLRDAAGDELKRNARAAADELADSNEKRRERDAKMLADATGMIDDAAKLANETDARRIDMVKDNLDRERALRLIALGGMAQDTVAEQLAVEQKRLAIELDYIDRKAIAEIDSIKRTHELELTLYRARAEVMLKMGLLSQEQYNEVIDAQIRASTQATTEVVAKSEAEKIALKEQSAVKQGEIERDYQVKQEQMARDNTKRIFESFKQQAGGVFDALLQKSSSVWAAMGNAFKVAMLTAIKDIVTSRVAQLLTQMVGGGSVGLSGGRGGAGATPTFGGALGSVAAVSSAGGLGGLRTPPFVGGAGTGSGGSSGGFGGLSGLSGMTGNLRDFVGLGSSISTGAGTATTFGAATFGQKLSSVGKSDAAMMGGALLAMDGIRRGGVIGTLEAGAGGAMLGYKFGGPWGAAIGAAAGIGAGIIRSVFFKSGEEKMREAIKKIWNIDITDKGVLKQLVDMAKQQFGGNYELAARSPAVREIVEQFAAMTGQRAKAPTTLQSAELAQRNGVTYQAGTSVNGQMYGYTSSLPSLGGNLQTIQGANVATAPSVVLQLDADATQDLLTGNAVEAMAQNPRAVALATSRAINASYSRRSTGAALLEPLTVTP